MMMMMTIKNLVEMMMIMVVFLTAQIY